MIKVPVVVRPEYRITYEVLETKELGDITFAHSEVLVPWTAEIRRRYTKDLQSLMRLRVKPLYVLCDNEKLRKFITLLGFKHKADVPSKPGMSIYIMEDPSWVK